MQRTTIFSLLLLVCLATAVQSQISIAPSTIEFGKAQVGQVVQQNVYVINDGQHAVKMAGIGGGVNSPFRVDQDCEGSTLAPGDSCVMTFTFNPFAIGPASTVSSGTWNGYGFNISINGTGTAPLLNIAPTDLKFEPVKIGNSEARMVFISNVGTAAVTLQGTGGGVDAPFSSVQTCQSTLLYPGQFCEIIFTFTPTTAGQVNATTSGTWNGLPYTITLTGNTTGNTTEVEMAETESRFLDW